MKKEPSLRIMMIVAAVAAFLDAMFGCFCTLAPKITWNLFSGGMELDDYSLGTGMPLMLAKALLPMLLCIIAAVNVCSDKYDHQKGLVTVISTAVSWLIRTIIGGGLTFFAIRTVQHNYGAEKVALLSSVSRVMSYTSLLSTVALVLITSAAAIEIYASNHADSTNE